MYINKKKYESLLEQIDSLQTTNERNFTFIKSLLEVEHKLKKQIDIPYIEVFKKYENPFSQETIKQTKITIPALEFVIMEVENEY